MTPAFDSMTYLLQKTAHYTLSAMELAVESLGINARQYLILSIAAAQADLSQNEIATRLGVDATVLGRLIGDLEDRGHLERRRAVEDRRRHELVLSTSGKKLLARAQAAARTAEDTALNHLTTQDQRALLELLRKSANHP
jgi:MarR family transcriptional regulator, lower aerobic nicotinate degradation pathway regulator